MLSSFWIWYTVLVITTPILAIFLYWFFGIRGKSLFLLLESEYESRSVRAKVKDGMVKIGNKMFSITEKNVKPFIHKTLFGRCPLYILYWGNPEPARIDFKTKIAEFKYNPETLKEVMDAKRLKGILRAPSKPTDFMMWIMIGILIGAMGAYVAIKGGYLG